MSCGYQEIFSFYNDVEKLCQPNKYNLVLHKHLGDVFYAIALKDEFERVYGKKLHFIVRPQHEFLMKMYGISDYNVYDLDKIVKKNVAYQQAYFSNMGTDNNIDCLENNTFQALFHCIPIIGKPFVCENLFYFFINYPHFWCFRWLKNLGIDDNFKFPLPKNKLSVQPTFGKKLKETAPIDKIVLFAPEAATATELAPEFWNIIADKVHEKGYKIIVNSKKYKINHGICAFDLGLSLEDVVALGLNCAYVFSLRSGLCDVLVGAGEKLYAFYPAMLKREMNSLTFPFAQKTNVNEILLEKWSISPVLWEDIDFTPELQKYIKSMKNNYFVEKIKYVFAKRNNKKGHKFWYMLFRNIFDKSKIFPNNNIDNTIDFQPECSAVKNKFRERLYKINIEFRADDRFVKKYYILGGLVRYKENERHCWKLSVLGIELLRYNKKKLTFFYIPVWKFNWRKKWLDKLQSQIDPKYDDIYLLRHNIGETTVELMFLQARIKSNQSKKPLLIIWDLKNIGYHNMFIKNRIDMQYIKLHQYDIMSVFSQQGENYKEVVWEQNNQRFICSTPEIAENMVLHNGKNFYDYIKKCCRISGKAKPSLPIICEQTKKDVAKIMQYLNLNKKFVIVAPEANSLVTLPLDFWQNIVIQLNKKGYDVFFNSFLSECAVKNVKTCSISLEELFYLAQKSECIITMGSGLSVLLALAQVPMDIIYTEFENKKIGYTATQAIQKYSVHHLPMVKKENIHEYNVEMITLDEIKKLILQKF